MYTLGIDLGTTYTAAAVHRDGRVDVVPLGSRVTATPSVVLVRDDRTMLTGEAASRRAVLEPHRVAREFKRRLGDSTPILLGGSPFSAEALTARLLRATVDEVVAREGGEPSAVCITHPANWGPFKTDLLLQAVRLAGLDGDPARPVTLVTEPEAAAAHHAQQQRIAPGSMIAVYDLGGGTFDAAVLRKTETGFVILGHPEGIERLGGIDVDAAVFGHVAQAVGPAFAELDEDDPGVVAAVARLRDECVQAKEALSADTDVSIPVLLPGITTEVRLTRAELEAMIRPALTDSVESLRRALAGAGVEPSELHSVLLVGGSSRIPLVAQLVGELGRPVTVDTHPKNAVALGAAWLAAHPAGSRAAGPTQALPVDPAPVVRPPAPPSRPAAPAVPPSVARPPAARPTVAQPSAATPGRGVPVAPMAGFVARPADFQPTEVLPATPPGGTARVPRQGRPTLSRSIFGGIGALLLIAGGVAVAASYAGGPERGSTGAGTGTAADAQAALPPDERCTDTIQANPRWVCLTSAVFDGEALTLAYRSEYGGSAPNTSDGYHLHLFGSDGTADAARMGRQAGDPGRWYETAANPSVKKAGTATFEAVIGDAVKVCARIADGKHRLVKDLAGGYATGNCLRIVRTADAVGATKSPKPRQTTRPTSDGDGGTPTGTATPTGTGSGSTSTPPTGSSSPPPTDPPSIPVETLPAADLSAAPVQAADVQGADVPAVDVPAATPAAG
jgi:molecular chaperone DnaK